MCERIQVADGLSTFILPHTSAHTYSVAHGTKDETRCQREKKKSLLKCKDYYIAEYYRQPVAGGGYNNRRSATTTMTTTATYERKKKKHDETIDIYTRMCI